MPGDSTASHQEAMAEVRRVVAEAKELSEAADGALTDQLATWVAGRYAVATRQLAADNGSGAIDWNLLRALCHDLVDLRRGDHGTESLCIERERLEMERAEQKVEMERRFWEWAKQNRAKICQPSMTDADREERIWQILGVSESAAPPPTQDKRNRGAASPAPKPQPNKGG